MLVYLNVTGRTTERIAQSKRARAGSLAIVDYSQLARTCILWAFGLQMLCRLSLVLRFFLLFTEAAALRSIVLRYVCVPTSTRSYLTTTCVLFVLFLLLPLEMSLFPSNFVPLPFSLCMESTSYVFPFRMVFFYLVTTGWIFYISLLRDNSINSTHSDFSNVLLGIKVFTVTNNNMAISSRYYFVDPMLPPLGNPLKPHATVTFSPGGQCSHPNVLVFFPLSGRLLRRFRCSY